MRRRDALKVLGACAVTGVFIAPAAAHTPYRQWQVYRRKHLLIGCHKDAPATYALAKELAAALDHHLPDASARVARAPNARRLASLAGTGQLDTAILAPDDARKMAAGEGAFKPYGEIPLRALFLFPQHVLVGVATIPDRHAWLIHAALRDAYPDADADKSKPAVAWHDGARRARAELPLSLD